MAEGSVLKIAAHFNTDEKKKRLLLQDLSESPNLKKIYISKLFKLLKFNRKIRNQNSSEKKTRILNLAQLYV